MAEVAPWLPFLETFEYYRGYLAENALTAIGKNCPHLTTLLYEQVSCQHYNRGKDDEAFAIAKHMPRLRRLSLLGNKLTNKGLGAILDGSPHLESLDLRQHFNANLMGDLAKKCERIKDLKCPWDPTANNNGYEDYYFDSDYISGLNYEDYDAEFLNYFGF